MRIVAYRDRGTAALGVMTDERRFIALADAAPTLPSSLQALLAMPDGLARAAAATSDGGGDREVDGVELLPLVDRPNAIWALALNFGTHVDETKLTTSNRYPQLFMRHARSLVGAGRPLLAPPPEIARAFDYEGELLVVIGRGGRHIPAERALEHVAGYSCMNEGSVREYQQHNRQFGLGKNFENSGSYGPWLVTADEFGDPAGHSLTTRLNGVVRQRASLGEMLFGVERVIAYLSQGYTLEPGDLIAMGTPGALPPAADDRAGSDLTRQHGAIKIPGRVHMVPGDVVEVEIDGIGVLRNPIAADGPVTYRSGSTNTNPERTDHGIHQRV